MMVKNSSRRPPSVQQELQSSRSAAGDPHGKKQYKGVRMRSWGSWVSEIRAPNQKTRIWLGSYSTPEAAARAYDAALLCLKGSSATLNFPNTPATYIPDALLSPKSIQRIAAEAAANAPSPPSSSSSSSSPTSSEPSSPLPMCCHQEGSHKWDDCYAECPPAEPLGSVVDSSPWFDFGGDSLSPGYEDQLINPYGLFSAAPFSTAAEECWDEEGDIHLWSFC